MADDRSTSTEIPFKTVNDKRKAAINSYDVGDIAKIGHHAPYDSKPTFNSYITSTVRK